MQHDKIKYHKSKLQALLYKQAVIDACHNWILRARKLISSILCHGTFKINHGQPWFITNVPWQRMQLISFYEICTSDAPIPVFMIPILFR